MSASCPRCGIDHSAGSSDCPAARLGSVLGGRYRLEEILGTGGFGAVYRAVHEPLGRRFAVKMLTAPLARRPEIAGRFLREAKVVAGLDHPGIVRVTDYGSDADGSPFLVMDLLSGRTVREHVRAHGAGLPLDELLAIARDALGALAAAHERGVVHRDLKPENLFLVDGGAPAVRLLDFGLARIVESGDGLTRSTEYMGTPQYSSPEQIERFGRVDARGDLYSMGAVLYFLATGEAPVAGADTLEVAVRVVQGEVERHPRRRRPDLPAALDEVVARAMAHAPEERFASASEMLAALDSAASGSSVAAAAVTRLDPGPEATGAGRAGRGRRLAWAATLAFVLALVAALAFVAWRMAAGPDSALPRAVPVEQVRLDALELRMGSTPAEVEDAFAWCRELAGADCRVELYRRELPRREVAVAAFRIDRFEVSNGDLARWLATLPDLRGDGATLRRDGELLADLRGDFRGIEAGAAGVRAVAGRERLPAVQVSWRAARDYCRSRGGDLPTEAQWERAARGGSGRVFPWGAERPDCGRIVYGRAAGAACADREAAPVAVDAPTGDVTPEGVAHLGGNVSEWTRDTFVAPYPECPRPCRDPWVDLPGPRVVRGGNWGSLAEMTRAAGRGRSEPGTTSTQIGFRCVTEEK
jgi:formylglycine-generating enzyme required for sulfatase activity